MTVRLERGEAASAAGASNFGIGRNALLALDTAVYIGLIRPLLFHRTAQQGHADVMRLLVRLDRSPLALAALAALGRAAFAADPVTAGGARLPHPLMLAAGFVKGAGFATERDALVAVDGGVNIIPGWLAMPRLVGPVEFGSFTRHPRLGNPGMVIWRDLATRSTQNRIGLKNPGAIAAAAFLARRRDELPAVYGLNIAVSPGVTDAGLERAEAVEAASAFLDRGLRPAWLTLNLSCPNTGDDPKGHQSEARARDLGGALADVLKPHGVPMWVKCSPDLATEAYERLLAALGEAGARAIVATNTLAVPAPDDPNLSAGVGGGLLAPHAMRVLSHLASRRDILSPGLDLVACGGIQNGAAFTACKNLGINAAQYMSALVYRGPLAAAHVEREGRKLAGHS